MEGWSRVMNRGDHTAKAMSGPSSSASLKSGDVVSDQFPVGLRVLVVDGDRTCLGILEKMLRNCLYEVTKCDRTEIALKQLRNNRYAYDIVISQVHMPGIDGFKLLELVGLEMDLPVIVMSADDSVNIVMKGVTHGARDYLIKPVTVEGLKNIWQHVVHSLNHEWKDKGQSGRTEEGEGLVKPVDVEDELEEKDDTSSLTPHVVSPVDLHQQFVAAVNELGIDSINQPPFSPLNGSFGSPSRLEDVQGFANMSDEELITGQFNSPNFTEFDVANNSLNGICEQQNRIVECSQGQELAQNIVSVVHNEPIGLINVPDPERANASIEQNGDEATNIKKQKSSCTLKSDLGITREILEQNSSRKLQDAAEVLGVSRSTLKRKCREHGIQRWPPLTVNQAFAEQRVVQPSTENIEECHRPNTTKLGDDSSMWVKAEYQGYTMKFRLPLSACKFNLEEKVAQRLNLSIGSFKIEYQDEDNEWIWIACDEDLSTCMSTLSSLGRITIKMLVR